MTPNEKRVLIKRARRVLDANEPGVDIDDHVWYVAVYQSSRVDIGPEHRRAWGKDGHRWAKRVAWLLRVEGDIRCHVSKGIRNYWVSLGGIMEPGFYESHRTRTPDSMVL